MTRAKARKPETQVKSGYAAARLTEEERTAANLERSPSEQLTTTPKCGARLATQPPPEEWDPANGPKTCTQPAGYGTPHTGYGYCKFHGGNTAAGRKSGAKKQVQELIDKRKEELARFGGHRDDPTIKDITPHEVLLEEVRRSVAMVRWIEERIGNWNIISIEDLRDLPTNARDKDLAGLPALQTETFKGTPTATDAHSWLILYREERGHMIRVTKLAIDSGVQERMVRIAEQQGEMLTVAIRAILAALNLTDQQMELVPEVVPRILRQVAADPATLTITGEVA